MLSGVCYKNTASVWDVSSGRLLFSLMKSPSHEVAVSFSPDGKVIATGGYSGKIGLYDSTTGELIRTFNTLPSAVWELDFSPSGDKLTSASFYSGMHLWDIANSEPLWNYGEKDMLRVLSVDYHPTGETIAYGTLANGVMIVDAKTGQPIKHLPITAPVGDVAFSPDGRWLAAGSDDNKIRLWRTADYELVKTLEGHTHYVNGVAFSPDGSLLVSGSHDKKVRIWDVQSGQLVKLLDGHEGVVLRVDMNSSGTLIASISWDGTVRLWGVVGSPQAETVSLTTEDNVMLSATLFGQGQPAVILAHQGTEGTDQKSWQPFAEVLAEKGYAALTLDFRGRGQSQGYLQASQLIKDVNAAIQFLRGRGYQRIVCMGASMGGTACLRAALDHDLAGLVVIASPMSSGAPTAVEPDELSRLTLPKLYVCAENDRYSLVIPQMKQMFELSPEPKQIKFFPGTVHGTELFDTEHGDEFRHLLLGFVERLAN
jgi:pimeloyl-ACP methyl ester carboxylesterase